MATLDTRRAQLPRLRATAHHEAGHAVVRHFRGLKFEYATIIPEPENESLGLVKTRPMKWLLREIKEQRLSNRGRDYLESDMICGLSGQIAEEKFRGRRPRYGMHSDDRGVFDRALLICGFGPPRSKTVDAYIHYCWCVAEDTVSVRWREVQAVAAALLDQKTIKYWDLVEIISPGTLDLRARLMRKPQKGA